MIQNQGNWVSYELKLRDIKRQLIIHLRAVDSKVTKKCFLHRVVTGDEKWILYDNSKKKEYYARSIVAMNLNISRIFMVRTSCCASGGTKKSCVLRAITIWQYHIGRSGYRLQLIRLSCQLREKTAEIQTKT